MTLDDGTRMVLARRTSADKPIYELSVEEARAGLKAMFHEFDLPVTPVARHEEYAVASQDGDVPVRVYWPAPPGASRPQRALLWFHGGGFTIGDMESQDNLCRFLCAQGEAVIINVDYRLAPEHKFPTGVEDCYTVLQWVAGSAGQLGIDPARIAVAGPSAGGTLALVVCMLSKVRQGPRIAYQIPLYPSFTMLPEHGYQSRSRFGGGEFGLTENEITWLTSCYLSSAADAQDFRASPVLFPDLSGLPPALVVTAGHDPLLDDGRDYARRLRDAGVPVEYRCYETTIHGFVEIPAAIPAGKAVLELIASRLRSELTAV